MAPRIEFSELTLEIGQGACFELGAQFGVRCGEVGEAAHQRAEIQPVPPTTMGMRRERGLPRYAHEPA